MMRSSASIDFETLRQLRSVVRALHDRDAVSVAQLVGLASELKMDAGLTIDFDASRELGEPMVVIRLKDRVSLPTELQRLTERERDVAQLLAEGLTNREIADRLYITLGTVKDHVHHILTKSGLRSRIAVITALRATR